jgi:cytochrome c-type biogenesis protein CcmH
VLLPLTFVLALASATVVAPLPPELEKEARTLETKLVAPCCWSQQVSVHQSPAADEVRQDVRRRLGRGENPQQILDDYVVQFGERILVEPPARGYKLMLYVLPPIALVLSGAAVTMWVRRAARQGAAVPAAEPAARTPTGDAYAARLEEELRDLD